MNKYDDLLYAKFDRKKTIQNDRSRIANINKHQPKALPLPIYNSPKVELITPKTNVYNFKQQGFTNINTNFSKEHNPTNLPRYLEKKIIESHKPVPIPTYSKIDTYNLNEINKNIVTPINMNISTPTPIKININTYNNNNDNDNNDKINNITKEVIIDNYEYVNRIKDKQIHTIFHVYQEKYIRNANVTGFGDFIRSCFFVIQFCTKYNLQYKIIINHPLAQFLKKFIDQSSYDINYNNTFKNIAFFSECNYQECILDNNNYIEHFLLCKKSLKNYIDYLCKMPIVNNSVFSYNIFFPYDFASSKECDKIADLFEPSNEIVDNVDSILSKLELVKKQFIILHIRSGDAYLKNITNKFDILYFKKLKNEISEIIFKYKDKDKKILLIADNNEIKVLLKEIFPDILYYIHNITHIGEGIELKNEEVKNTMTDFYLMSNSSAIFSITTYKHGSGFSYWCSKLYKIPYRCKYIKN
jgi:hypothetical protein